MALSWSNPYWNELANEHRQWLADFDPRYLRKWENSLKGDDEAAMAEAITRRTLQDQGTSVGPNEDLAGARQRPDFRCTVADMLFYVEVTCINRKSIKRRMRVGDEAHGEVSGFNITGMARAIFTKCVNKASQCARMDAPTLAAIGTFHGNSAMLGFEKTLLNFSLTGETKLAYFIDPKTGDEVGVMHHITNLHATASLRPEKEKGIAYARSSLSGLLLCGFSLNPPLVRGLLHPNPVRPFDPSLLPDIEFGQVDIDHPTERLHVRWPKGNDD